MPNEQSDYKRNNFFIEFLLKKNVIDFTKKRINRLESQVSHKSKMLINYV